MALDGIALLDGTSALLACLVGIFFFRVWRRSAFGLDLLLTCSFAFLGVAFAVSAAQVLFDLDPESAGYPRFSLELAGVLALLAAYASSRAKVNAGPALLVGWGLAGAGLLFILAYVLVPPALALSPIVQVAPYAHSALAVAWSACAGFASTAWAKRRIPTRATVGLGYLSLALSYYTWAIVEIGDATRPMLVAYAWRLLGILLVGLAVLLPPRGGAPHAGAT